MGRGKKIAKNYVVNKWQNPFHYIVSPLCLTSYQCPKHNIYICILCFKGPPTTSSFMAMPTVNETTSWSVSFSSEAPARSAGPLSHPGLTSTKLAKGGAQHFSFYFPSELNLATLLWPLSVYIITFIYIYIYIYIWTFGNDFKCFYLYWQESFVQFSNKYLWHMNLSLYHLSIYC